VLEILKWKLLCKYLLYFLSASFSALHGQDRWIQLTTTRLKPGMFQEWRKAYKSEVIPGYKTAGGRPCAVWRSGPFGDPHEVILMSPIGKFAQFDGEESTVTSARLDKYVSAMESTALLWEPDISVAKENAAPPELILLQTVTIPAKTVGGYLAFLRDELKPVIVKGGVDFWMVYRHVFGSEASQITSVRSLKNYAELDAGPLAARVLGPEAASLLSAKSDQFVESSRIVIAHYDRELSYGRIF